jgi:cysteine desulfurase
MVKLPIYLDNHSTTKVDPRVFEAMKLYFTENYGNAASKSHVFGWKAEAAVKASRKEIAGLINAEPREIIFTSGATESINLALKGAAEAYSKKGKKIITTSVEHKAVLDSCLALQRKGYEVKYLKVDKFGLIDINELENELDENTIVVSIIAASNEIGTVQHIKVIGTVCRKKDVLFHIDAAQALGKIKLDVNEMNIDLMSLSAHKIYGPKGIGALYVRSKNPKVNLIPQIDGGGHERGFRSGTLNVPGIVGFGMACKICRDEMENESRKLLKLRERLHHGINKRLKGVYLNGHPDERLSGNLNLSFEYVDADSLVMSMKDIAVSSGSACSSEEVEPSHVLKAIGVKDELVRSAIRFGIGRFNTEEEIDYTIDRVCENVTELRNISPAYRMSGEFQSASKQESAV